MKVENIEAIRIHLASPEQIEDWSHGEVTEPETINYRTQKPEKNGLFCEKIFGPEKDYQCYCGKYQGVRYKGTVCDRCGVEITKSSVRRERMGHIDLAAPCSHIWFLRGVPSVMGRMLNISKKDLEKVIYFAGYIVTEVNEDNKEETVGKIQKEYEAKTKSLKKKLEGEDDDEDDDNDEDKNKKKIQDKLNKLRDARDRALDNLKSIEYLSILSESEYQKMSLKYGNVFRARTGAEALQKVFEEINVDDEIERLKERLENETAKTRRVKLIKRLKLFEAFDEANLKPEWMFLNILPVLPPDLRPLVKLDGGRYASSDLNDLYRRVINRNNRLRHLLEIKAPEIIVRNEKRMLQESVDALIDNGMRKGTTTRASSGGRRLLKSLADMLKGKSGRFRKNLLGKRVDYSGRSVIVVGPTLNLDQAGIPKKMALELFKPFVIHEILERELAYNVKGASNLIEQGVDEVWGILEEVVKDKLILLNRAPTLHRLGIQAFQPVLVEGEAIRVHPLVCSAFNADFDGDQMAIHLPLSKEAQKESRERMLSSVNLLKPATGLPIVDPTKDITIGCYHLTKIMEEKKGEGKKFGSPEEAKLAYEHDHVDLRAEIEIRTKKGNGEKSEFIKTSVGRLKFNDILPDEYPFQNILTDSKTLEKIAGEIIEQYGNEIATETLDKLKNLGFEQSTLSGLTWGMTDLKVPKEKEEIIKEAENEVEQAEKYYEKGLLTESERKNKIIQVWTKAKEKIEELVPKGLPKNESVYEIIASGSRGSWSQGVQMAGMKGLVINPSGETMELPVTSSFKEGFDVLEYFISTHGARKGTADKALRTSTAGYLTRRLVDVAHDLIVREEDCGDNEGLVVRKEDAEEIGQDYLFKLVGRKTLETLKDDDGNEIVKKGNIINWQKAKAITKADNIESVRVRSPLTCNTTDGVCKECYGWDLGKNRMIEVGEAVGVVAAQAIGEPGTQLTMRTFHTGGVASGGGDITFGLPRAEEIFEVRTPKGEAAVAETDGKVIKITEDNVIKFKPKEKKKKKKKKEDNVIDYDVPSNRNILVKEGQKLEKGDQLYEGRLDLEKLFELSNKRTAQKYILKELQRIYASHGAFIHDKHMEAIVRQMFSRVKIIEPGEAPFTPGEIIEKSTLLRENEKIKDKDKKAKAKTLLLGITRVALTTDSFLSSASFQQTSRVLIKAAVQGKKDELKGLKENVKIGKLIPVGTGFRNGKKEKEKEKK